MKKTLLTSRQWMLLIFIVIAILTRWLPHPPNFTAVTAIALFGGVHFSSKKLAYIIPLAAMLLSDLVLGFSGITLFVYIAFGLVSFLGTYFKKMSVKTILLSSSVFFVITNFGVWLLYYPLNVSGLMECYTLAIPFFRNSVLGDLFFAGVLYYGFFWAEKKFLQTA
jgi:hypothetical protein